MYASVCPKKGLKTR